MQRNKHFWIFGSVILMALLVMSLPQRAASRLKLALGAVFLPLTGISQSSGAVAETTATALTPASALADELMRLRKENETLKAWQMQSQEVWRENERLRQLLGYQKQNAWKLKLAQVVGRDPANWWRGVDINLGDRDGMCPNLPVMTDEGLIGRVAETGRTMSRVVLLGDPKCRISALVPEAKDSGIVSPGAAGIWDHTFLTLGYLSRGSDLRPGQQVITSGMGGLFPKGIRIGQIVDTRSVDALYLEARIKIAANLSSLEEVWVVMP